MTNLAFSEKSKKRKRGEGVFRFKTFGEHGYPVEFEGSFRQNIKALLEYGHFENNSNSGMPSWSFQLEVNRHPPFHILLFVIEEPIEASLERHCRQCQYVGWGHHMICNKKYHFVLPSKDTVALFLDCQGKFDGSISIKNSFNLVELQGHVMHGVLHSNGFGHLLSVNGIEGGSNLAGRQIMEFWDRLCTCLGARKVSLYDVSQKRGMELRLIHGVAYGEPWFGPWGYKFGRGSFGVTEAMHRQAIETIQGMPLCILLVHYLGNSNHDIPVIFSRYQTLSDHSLVTLGDLFRFMFELNNRLPKENSFESYNTGIFVEPSRWSPKRIEMATRVIVEALKGAETRWVPRQEIRDVARTYIGDTGLLDFVLKSLGNHIVGNYLVRRSLNPVTKVLEYCLEDVSNVLPDQEGLVMNKSPRCKMSRGQVMKDVVHLYKNILRDNQPILSNGILVAISAATRIIIDSKYLVKEYKGENWGGRAEIGIEGKLKLYCTVMVRNKDEEEEEKLMPPYECVTLRNNATFEELRIEVERNFREVYWGMRGLVVESAVNVNAKGREMVFGVMEVGREIIFKGRNKGSIEREMMYESGGNNKAIECGCGAKQEDGERMVSCDICEVWQHSRCAGIPNNHQLPHIFLCPSCEHEIINLPSLP